MTGERHCDLCDLPFAQCAHGLALRQRRAETKAKKKQQRQKTSQGQASKAPTAAGLPEAAAAAARGVAGSLRCRDAADDVEDSAQVCDLRPQG